MTDAKKIMHNSFGVIQQTSKFGLIWISRFKLRITFGWEFGLGTGLRSRSTVQFLMLSATDIWVTGLKRLDDIKAVFWIAAWQKDKPIIIIRPVFCQCGAPGTCHPTGPASHSPFPFPPLLFPLFPYILSPLVTSLPLPYPPLTPLEVGPLKSS